MATSNGPSTNTQTIRNIVVGVTTTVLASTIVYFLGFQSKSKERSAAEVLFFTKEATTKAWNEYVSTENMFTKNWSTLAANYNNSRFKNYKDATLEELDKFFKDINRLIETKDVDPIFVSLLKRRLSARKQWETKYRTHLDNYENILNNVPQQEQYQKLNDELNRFTIDVKDLDERFVNEVENVAKTLSENYHYNFSSSELLAFKKVNADTVRTNTGTVGQGVMDRQSLVGNWIIDQNWYIYQYDDGRLYMYFSRADGARDSTYGTWQVINGQLYQYATYYFNAGNKWVYDVTDITANSFTLKLTTTPYTVYIARRYN